MLFADDFVGVSNSEEELQRLINVAHAYCCKWRLKANVSKSAVVVFARELSRGILELGRTSSPKIIEVYLLRCCFYFKWCMGRACKKSFAEWQEKD